MTSLLFFMENGDHLQSSWLPKLSRKVHLVRYEYAKRYARNKKVLDLGCGYGYGSFILSSVAESVVGVDANIRAIQTAKLRYARNSLTFVQDDGLRFLTNCRAKFELVTMFEFIEHVTRQRELIRAIWDSLEPSGVLILSTPNRQYSALRHNPYHVKEFSLTELVWLISSLFEIVELGGQLPGQMAFLPLPYHLIMTILSLFPSSPQLVAINRSPRQSRTIFVVAKKRGIDISS
jgi:SAM-dependent methyltransferase